METKINELTKELMAVNPDLPPEKARIWIELLVSDFESSYAKAGYDYRGFHAAEKIVRQWIASYGSRLHEFAATNPKYAHLLNDRH
ncbi:YfhJ family protein [Indiicoccus explosivorum]|uniref:YfhJ family protein n=1 Tax=Indiicoccus explosivorum TaxID=1917864 RepID=UPI000B443993|nr:YfhJ family protein [Indiicoccus explosivorum]